MRNEKANNWWQVLDAVKRFELMKKHGYKSVTDKIITLIYLKEQ